MLKRVSIFWIILGALLLTSAIPLTIIAYRSIQTTTSEVEREQKQQLLNRVDAHAAAINEQFRQFEITTNVSATRARELLLVEAPRLTDEQLATGLANYRHDAFGIYGLDAYYLEKDGRVPAPEQYNISNLYVNRFTELTPELQRQILATQELDELFGTIRAEGFGSQWLYLTTEQFMRLYPWHPNQYGPPRNWPIWEPWTILFYTAASDQGVYILQLADPTRMAVVEQLAGDKAESYLRNTTDPACPTSDTGTHCFVRCSDPNAPLQATYCAGTVDAVYVLNTVQIVNHITGDNALRYFRGQVVNACAAGGPGNAACYIVCSDPAAPLHAEYCQGATAGVVVLQPVVSLDFSSEAVTADQLGDVPRCPGDSFGEAACYIDCSDAADPLQSQYCLSEEGYFLLQPINPVAVASEQIVGITKDEYARCEDTGVGSGVCYLDCTDYTHPLHPQFCRGTVWTPPYYDYAGQGLMVTNSLPIYDESDRVIGVMSHDLRIDVMERQVLGFQVGEDGFAFLLDPAGQIIAHRDYSPEQFAVQAQPGEPQFQILAEQEPDIAPIVARMTAGESGVASYTDREGKEWIVAYTSIASTGWHLGLAQPRDEIVAPATKIRGQVLTGAGVMVLVVLAMSVWLAGRITRPVLRLAKAAKEIEASVDSETTDIIGTNLAQLSNLSSAREISNLASVFEQMVLALQQRMTELNSIYAMGQTITANVDYDETLRAVLDAVGQVVTYDGAEVALLKGNQLVVEAWKGGEGFNNTTGRKYKVGRGPTGQIAETRKSLLLPTVSDTEDIQRTLGYGAMGSEFIGRTTKIVINSFLGIPLQIGDRLIGTLTLVHRDKEHFDTDDERQLNKLAAQASVAIQNATQVREREQQLKRQIEELRVEIDQAKLTKQIEEVTDSDFFRQLQSNAAQMRRRFSQAGKGKTDPESSATAPDATDDTETKSGE